jgi:hypothetical protein
MRYRGKYFKSKTICRTNIAIKATAVVIEVAYTLPIIGIKMRATDDPNLYQIHMPFFNIFHFL